MRGKKQEPNEGSVHVKELPALELWIRIAVSMWLVSSVPFYPSLVLVKSQIHIPVDLETIPSVDPQSATQPKSLGWWRSPENDGRDTPMLGEFSLRRYEGHFLSNHPLLCSIHRAPCNQALVHHNGNS